MTDAEICTLALSHLGVSIEINNLETEKSKEAQACRRFYATTRDEVLRDFSWPFAKVIEALALVEEDPNTEWGFSYRYPSGCLKVRRVLNGSGVRVDTEDTRVPFTEGRDTTGLLIFTDQEDAEVEYTMRETDTERYPADFVDTLSLLLASKIGPRVAGGDQFKLADRALKLYAWRKAVAEANAANEEQVDKDGPSGFERARG